MTTVYVVDDGDYSPTVVAVVSTEDLAKRVRNSLGSFGNWQEFEIDDVPEETKRGLQLRWVRFPDWAESDAKDRWGLADPFRNLPYAKVEGKSLTVLAWCTDEADGFYQAAIVRARMIYDLKGPDGD